MMHTLRLLEKRFLIVAKFAKKTPKIGQKAPGMSILFSTHYLRN